MVGCKKDDWGSNRGDSKRGEKINKKNKVNSAAEEVLCIPVG
jgi:hypothetical protein